MVVAPPWRIEPLFTQQPNFFWSPMPESACFDPPNIAQKLGKMANVILLPVPDFGGTMAYQLQSGMRFTQSSGYVGFEPVPERRYRALDGLDLGNLEPGFGRDLAGYCAMRVRNDALRGGHGEKIPGGGDRHHRGDTLTAQQAGDLAVFIHHQSRAAGLRQIVGEPGGDFAGIGLVGKVGRFHGDDIGTTTRPMAFSTNKAPPAARWLRGAVSGITTVGVKRGCCMARG